MSVSHLTSKDKTSNDGNKPLVYIKDGLQQLNITLERQNQHPLLWIFTSSGLVLMFSFLISTVGTDTFNHSGVFLNLSAAFWVPLRASDVLHKADVALCVRIRWKEVILMPRWSEAKPIMACWRIKRIESDVEMQLSDRGRKMQACSFRQHCGPLKH